VKTNLLGPLAGGALKAAMISEAKALGASLVGITGDPPARDLEFFRWWTNQGFGAAMDYLRYRPERKGSLEAVLPGAKSAIVCAFPFPGPSTQGVSLEDKSNEDSSAYGKVARYASGIDYHKVVGEKIEHLASAVDRLSGTTGSLAYVDTGPLNERSLATNAGLGWVGKNAMLIHPEFGSWFWLGEVITKAELPKDAPMADHCGTCRRCLDACPTGAILEEVRAIDSRKCISFWNIEHRGDFPKESTVPLNGWLLGCDICQEVCPWNQHSLKKGRKDLGAPKAEQESLERIGELSEEAYAKEFRHRAHSRAKRTGLIRNALSLLGKKP
jgi:epoxyqueuosine reductase